MRKVVYIANMRLPSERAHSVQIMRMCLAFARNGASTTLYVPSRRTHIKENPFTFYNIEPIFDLEKVWSIDLFHLAWMPRAICYFVNSLTYAAALLIRAKTLRRATVISRDPISTFFLSWFLDDLTYEVHDTPKHTALNRWFVRRVHRIIATNTHKKNVLIEQFGVSPGNVLVAHHGVDRELFTPKHGREEARRLLNLDPHATYVVYTGHLYDWKGVYTLARAARLLPQRFRVLMVGGEERDIAAMRSFLEREGIRNVTLTGFEKHERMPLYLAAADVVVIPTSARYTIGRCESSPLKLFEYMASGKPIVASDIPAIRDIADDTQVYFMKPDSATDCARVIEAVAEGEHIKREAELARVAHQTWENRARAIMDFAHT